jgi:hypothetical protein
MLENAKLKDEVALQGVGISNLTARLIKQQIAADRIEKVLRKYDTKVNSFSVIDYQYYFSSLSSLIFCAKD